MNTVLVTGGGLPFSKGIQRAGLPRGPWWLPSSPDFNSSPFWRAKPHSDPVADSKARYNFPALYSSWLGHKRAPLWDAGIHWILYIYALHFQPNRLEFPFWNQPSSLKLSIQFLNSFRVHFKLVVSTENKLLVLVLWDCIIVRENFR